MVSCSLLQRLDAVNNHDRLVHRHVHGIDADLFGKAPDRYAPFVLGEKWLLDQPVGIFADQDLGIKLAGKLFEPGTELTVQKCQVHRGAEQSAFRLDIGKIWIRVLRVLSQQDKFLINTPTATAGVRGTMFAVEVTADGSTEISVYEGQVTVASDSGEVKVAANETARLGSSQAGPQVTPLSAQQQQSWQQQMQRLGPYLEITSPVAEAEFTGRTVTVKGRCERGANLTVNDQAVTQKPNNGRFTVELAVPAYVKHFTVEAVATDRKGYTTTVRRHLVQLVHEELLAPVSPGPGTTA